jgi:hypothetical protein
MQSIGNRLVERGLGQLASKLVDLDLLLTAQPLHRRLLDDMRPGSALLTFIPDNGWCGVPLSAPAEQSSSDIIR